MQVGDKIENIFHDKSHLVFQIKDDKLTSMLARSIPLILHDVQDATDKEK